MPRLSKVKPNRIGPYDPVPELPKTGFVRLPTILSLIPISTASWWNGIKAGKYPKGISLGPRTTAWRVADIKALIESIGQ
jgi:prophage regulatory protein